MQTALNENPHKSIKNLISDYVPKSLAEFVLKAADVNIDEKCHKINGKTRDLILEKLQNFEVTAQGTVPDSEVVTAGGVDLKEINPKTMESKLVKGLYFCGEVMDIDGFCGGFNLQNCWSTGFAAAKALNLTLSS
ncbi:MAG: NAD(P)/FAD-dependent oxidoreductase [Candidatus Gastranaerophilaceae bacterium]